MDISAPIEDHPGNSSLPKENGPQPDLKGMKEVWGSLK